MWRCLGSAGISCGEEEVYVKCGVVPGSSWVGTVSLASVHASMMVRVFFHLNGQST